MGGLGSMRQCCFIYKNWQIFVESSIESALLKGNELDINSAFNEDGFIKANIRRKATYRINFCKAETKLAIPKLIKKLPEGIELDEERIENLAAVFPLQYLSMFEVMRKRK